MAGATKEERKANLEAAMAKRREELKGRVNEQNAKTAMARHHPELKGNDNAAKVDVIIKKFIIQLIDENRGSGLLDVDYTNKEMVSRRKDQMSIIKEHINLIKQLKDVRNLLADENQEDNKSNLRTAENVVLMDEAKELLAKKGIRLEA